VRRFIVAIGALALALTLFYVLASYRTPTRSPAPERNNEMTQPVARPELPQRAGPRPRATPTNPHTQLDQNAPPALQQALAARIFGLSCVEERRSAISVPGARALWLREECNGHGAAFMIGREFAHLHPPSDGSLHAALPPEWVDAAIAAGWAELHPLAARGLIPKNIVMIYGPRDDHELAVVTRLVEASWSFAHGR
jgi:hypothetical protein